MFLLMPLNLKEIYLIRRSLAVARSLEPPRKKISCERLNASAVTGCSFTVQNVLAAIARLGFAIAAV